MRSHFALLTEKKKLNTNFLTIIIDDKAFDLHQKYELPWEVDENEQEILRQINSLLELNVINPVHISE